MHLKYERAYIKMTDFQTLREITQNISKFNHNW